MDLVIAQVTGPELGPGNNPPLPGGQPPHPVIAHHAPIEALDPAHWLWHRPLFPPRCCERAHGAGKSGLVEGYYGHYGYVDLFDWYDDYAPLRGDP